MNALFKRREFIFMGTKNSRSRFQQLAVGSCAERELWHMGVKFGAELAWTEVVPSVPVYALQELAPLLHMAQTKYKVANRIGSACLPWESRVVSMIIPHVIGAVWWGRFALIYRLPEVSTFFQL